MIIECPYCESRVDAKVLADHESFGKEDPFPCKVSLLACPVCKNALLAVQERIPVGPGKHEWSDATRRWPEPEEHADWSVPRSVRGSLEEAKKCYKAKAYSACAVMCRRVLESICAEHGIKNGSLHCGLQKLLAAGIIHKKLHKWGEALREKGNLGAHATGVQIPKEDAKDLVDFAEAICENVFVLASRFDDFMQRKGNKE